MVRFLVFALVLAVQAGAGDSTPAPAAHATWKTAILAARELARTFDYPAAQQLMENAIAAESEAQWNALERAIALKELGWLYHMQGRLQEARIAYLRSVVLQDACPDAPAKMRIATHNSLTRLFMDLRDPQRAAEYCERAVREGSSAGPATAAQLAIALNNRAELFRVEKDYQNAASFYQKSLATLDAMSRPNPAAKATTLNNLGTLYSGQGNLEAAMKAYQDAIRLWRQSRGTDDPVYAQSLANLAAAYTEAGRYEAARPMFLQAIERLEQALGPNSSQLVSVLANYAYLLRRNGQSRQAGKLEDRARKILAEHRRENFLNQTVDLSELDQR